MQTPNATSTELEGGRVGAVLTMLASVILAAAFVAGFHVKVIDADVLMHLRTGRLIAETHAVPRTDPYSATAAGAEWVDHEWLWQWLAHCAYSAGGWMGLSIARMAAIGGGLSFCAMAARSRGTRWIHVMAASLVAICPLMVFAEIRPQTASFFVFPLLVWILETSKTHIRRLWAIPVIFLAWANMHGAFIIGFVLAGCYVAGWVVDDWRHKTKVSGRKGKANAAATSKSHYPAVIAPVGAGLAVSLINPYGLKALTFSLRVVKYAFITSHVYEWAPPEMSRFFVPFYLTLAVTILVLAINRSRDKPADWILLAVFGFFALRMRRQIAFFPLATMPALASGISSLAGKAEERFRPKAVWVQAVPFLLAMCLLGAAFVFYSDSRAPFGSGLTPGRFPEQAAAKLAESGTGGTVFNDYNDGGYLIWRLWPKWKVSMDGRVDVYGPDTTREYQNTWKGAAGCQDSLRAINATAVLGRREILRISPARNLYSELAKDPNWKAIYQDKTSMLFLKQPLK